MNSYGTPRPELGICCGKTSGKDGWQVGVSETPGPAGAGGGAGRVDSSACCPTVAGCFGHRFQILRADQAACTNLPGIALRTRVGVGSTRAAWLGAPRGWREGAGVTWRAFLPEPSPGLASVSLLSHSTPTQMTFPKSASFPTLPFPCSICPLSA